jgi:hypothetical protein
MKGRCGLPGADELPIEILGNPQSEGCHVAFFLSGKAMAIDSIGAWISHISHLLQGDLRAGVNIPNCWIRFAGDVAR